MNEAIKALFASDDLAENKVPWRALVLSLLGLVSYFGLVGTTSLARWMVAGRAYSPHAPSDTIVYFVGYALGVHLLLTWPMTTMAFPQLTKRSRLAQLGVPSFLAALPLVSFAAYLGGVKDLIGMHEALLIVVPAVVLATHFYLVSEQSWIYTLTIVAATFIPFWIANDILATFPVLFGYASKGGELYFWRSVIPVFTTAAALYYTGRETVESRENASLRWATLAVGAYSLALFVALPLAAEWSGEISGFSLHYRDFGVALFLVVSFFLWRPSRAAYIGLLSIAGVQALVVGLWLVWYSNNLKLVSGELFRVSYGAAVFALALAIVVTLTRAEVRGRFLAKK